MAVPSCAPAAADAITNACAAEAPADADAAANANASPPPAAAKASGPTIATNSVIRAAAPRPCGCTAKPAGEGVSLRFTRKL